MTSYFIDEAALELPSDRPVVDRTVHVLEVPGDGAADLRLVVERETVGAGETLASRVQRRLAEHATKLRGFEIVQESERPVGGLPGLVVRARWRHPKGRVHTIEAHVAVRDRHLAFVASARAEQADACDAWATSIFDSIRFRDT